MTLLPGNWTPYHICRQAVENITHKGHWGASLGLEVSWPQNCWASPYTPYEWCMSGWSLVQRGEGKGVSDSSHRSKWALIKGTAITLTSASFFQWMPPGVEETASAGWKGLEVHVCLCVKQGGAEDPVTVNNFSFLKLKLQSEIDRCFTLKSWKVQSTEREAEKKEPFFLLFVKNILSTHACFLSNGGNMVR